MTFTADLGFYPRGFMCFPGVSWVGMGGMMLLSIGTVHGSCAAWGSCGRSNGFVQIAYIQMLHMRDGEMAHRRGS